MLRTFSEHDVRNVLDLTGRWEFVTADDRKDRGRLPKKYTRTVHVPSAWEQLPGLEAYRGKAWYRTRVPGEPGMALRLVFGGVSHTGTVFVDGKKVGSHYDAFTPWDVVVPSRGEEHEVVVEVDNTFGEHSALHIENDYYTYGGLTRPVAAEYVPEVYIDRLWATPRRQGKRWSLDLTVRLKNWTRQAVKREVVVFLDEMMADLGMVTVKPGDTREVKGTLDAFDATAWDPKKPTMYEIEGCLFDAGEVVDDLIDRVGFREVKVRGKKLLLNGKPLHLRGFNRHEDHPQFGNALPVDAMVTDLEILRDLNCNFVRTCHYPNDMRFLDLCDELGFLVWEESHARNVKFSHPKYKEQITASTTEMVDWHRNHPSIILWGTLNECDSNTPSGAREHARVLKIMKTRDGSRPVTFASNRHINDLCCKYVDVVSWNRYDAWYGGGPDDVEPRIKAMLKWLHSPKSKGGKGKPVIMSEFGAGGMYGYRHPHRAKWTEEYMCDCLDESLRVYLNHPDIVGTAIWQFCDVRITKEWWQRRPRTMNNKGTVDEFRRPKLCYEVVKRRHAEAMKRRK